MVLAYALYGVGKGVWESTNRAVSASMFPAPVAPLAFALLKFGQVCMLIFMSYMRM